MDELIKHSDKLGFLGVVLLFIYREFIAHHAKKDRESIVVMREHFEAFEDSAFKKLSAMHELLRSIDQSQKIMREQKDDLAEAIREQTRMFHEFHVDMKLVLERIGHNQS